MTKSSSGAARKTATSEAGRPPNGEAALGPLAGFIGFHLRLAQDASFRVFAKHAGQRDLKPGRFAAMMVIANNPGITQAALGRAIARDKSSVTPLLQDLQRHGLVARQRSAADRRSVTLSLTASGQAQLRRLLAHAREHDRNLDRIVGVRKPEFLALLRKIADTLS